MTEFRKSGRPARAFALPTPAILALLTGAAMLVHGYHPYAEDAGIYVAGVKLAMRPTLYPAGREFIAAHTGWSVFAPFMAGLTRATGLPLEWVLFFAQIVSVWMVLFGCWRIAELCFESIAGRWGAVVLMACCLTLPVAGTSLSMMDPYVTARAISTPCILLAIAGCLRRRWTATLAPLAVAALVHPLMAIYAAGFLCLLWAAMLRRWAWLVGGCAAGLVAAAAMAWSQRRVVETAAYRAAALTRTYFYLSRWEWYELVGAAAPVLMMGGYAIWRMRDGRPGGDRGPAANLAAVCWASAAAGSAAILVSALFAHPLSQSHLVARLQPLRIFHIIYLLFTLLLGGMVAQLWLKRAAWRWVALFGAAAGALLYSQLMIYPASSHIEVPWARQSNPWTQAFAWIRQSTPENALFALDARYITAPQEDAQGFRAEAERSALADYSKDGGASAIFPQLAPDWMAQHTADDDLSGTTDAQRVERLRPFGVGWVVLQKGAQTEFSCPYRNAYLMVCQMPAAL